MSDSKLGELEARLAAVRRATEAGFVDRARALCDAADALDRGEADARDLVRRLAHQLRGVAGSAGHPELTDKAGALEQAANGDADDRAIAEAARLLAQAAQAASHAPKSEPKENQKREIIPKEKLGWRVIAVDDDPSTRRLLSITLGQVGGCDAHVTDDPARAIEMMSEPVDLVIVDAMMPTVSGLELYRAIRRRAGDRLPIAILSAASPQELGWELPDDAELRWMRKPFRPGLLLAELRAFVGRAR